MAVFLLFIFFISLHEAQAQAQAQTNHSIIKLGSSLNPVSNSSWLSPSGRYAFGFYNESDGFAVGIFIAGFPEKTVVWIANFDPPNLVRKDRIVSNNATLILTIDGGLMLQSEGNQISITDPGESVASASMQDNGNFLLYNSGGKIIWQSFERPSDTLLPGQRLSADKMMFSRASETDYSKGIFSLVMQSDGNLVQYPINFEDRAEYSYYSTETSGIGKEVSLNLDDDGQLYLLNSTKLLGYFNPGGYPTKRMIYMMRLDVDGIFKVYSVSLDSGKLTAVWRSLNDTCAPKGRCGVNGFCVPMGQDISCSCLPGFDFLNEGNQLSGCGRNSTLISCEELNKTVDNRMLRSVNTVWDDSPYDVFKTINVEDCEQKCMEDCNCEVALFKDQICTKQRLPLRFGRKNFTDPSIALIKVGKKQSIGDEDKKIIIKKVGHTNVLIIGISIIGLGILVGAIAGIVLNRYHKWSYKNVNLVENLDTVNDFTLQAFSYEQLVQITNNFSEQVGKGASGTVYKGILSHPQTIVAVKKLGTEFAEGEREFETEIKVIARTHHRNLVSLLGYCRDGTNMLLVYEFMGNGSLSDVLCAPRHHLSWNERVRIATDIVKGIHYLHEECETQIIHCDIKPQNILIDLSMHAKISDFGLAKLLKQDQSTTYTTARGTKGYVAPEWFRKLPVTIKVDVYSFGIVLLEIIFHRRNVNWSLPENEVILEEYVYSCFVDGELNNLVPDEEIDMEKLERWVKVGIWCIQEDPSLRPSMKEVLLMLEGKVDIPTPPSPPC